MLFPNGNNFLEALAGRKALNGVDFVNALQQFSTRWRWIALRGARRNLISLGVGRPLLNHTHSVRQASWPRSSSYPIVMIIPTESGPLSRPVISP